MKTVLAIGAHPDDVEFGCGGTLLLLKELGYLIVIVDLTRGQKAQHGAGRRIEEATEAAGLLGAKREILNLGDKEISLSDDHKNQVRIIVEKYPADIVFAPYFADNHPDHENAGKLVAELSSPIHYFLRTAGEPNIGVNITSVFEKKQEVLYTHKSQIRSGDREWIVQRAEESGKILGVKYGEIFYTKTTDNLPDIFRYLNDKTSGCLIK